MKKLNNRRKERNFQKYMKEYLTGGLMTSSLSILFRMKLSKEEIVKKTWDIQNNEILSWLSFM